MQLQSEINVSIFVTNVHICESESINAIYYPKLTCTYDKYIGLYRALIVKSCFERLNKFGNQTAAFRGIRLPLQYCAPYLGLLRLQLFCRCVVRAGASLKEAARYQLRAKGVGVGVGGRRRSARTQPLNYFYIFNTISPG